MVNLTGEETEKSEDLTQVSETRHSFANSSQNTNGDCAHLETTGAYPAENEVVAEATQWEQRIEDILTACKTLKQSESFLSDFSSLTRDSRQNTEVDEEKSKQNTALEPSETPASSQDIIQATPLEANSYRNRKRFRNKNIMVQACRLSNQHALCLDSLDKSDILFEETPEKRVKNNGRKKRILDETKTTDDEEIGQNTGRSEAAKQIMDSCESAVETSILNPSSESLNNSESNCEGESHKSEHQKRAKRKIQSEADEENDQASNTIRKKAKKKLSTVKKRRLSSDEEADEASDHSYEDADPNDSDAALKFFLGLKRFNRDFKVPRLHKIVDRASNPTADQRERIAEKGIEVKTGKFSSAEDQQIQENWLNFIQVFRLKNQPQKFFCLHAKRVTPEAKRNFLFYLARGLHNRTPYCVFKRFKLLMDRVTKGRFSQEEDDFILKAMEEKPKMSVTEVAKHLHRSLLAVSCRIGKLKTTYSRKIKWSGRNAASYIKYLLEATDIDEKDIGLLKNRQITAEEWAKLSEKLDNVPVRILKPVWLNFLHPALFIPGNSCDLGAIKWKLAKRLHKNNETEWSCIDWTKYVARFEGFTSLKLYTLVKQLIKTHVPEKKQPDLPRSLKYLMKNKLRIAAQPLKLLYKIKYRNGEIQDMRLSDL
ncbi:hypothetical protein D910_06884 [Dendroctonus ponderosae]|uniref:Myb-like domain-containing protein n=1 Tax=Dendroctonus ponderosae TaxID=77166 RepID=U4UB27_DENPD|nr:hypothetical protein D910_06884 [Dendroctonus ponderosae]